MTRVRSSTLWYEDKFIFADGDFLSVPAAIVIRPGGDGAFVLFDAVVEIAQVTDRPALVVGLAPQRSSVCGLDTGCAAACSVVTQPLRVLPMPVPSSARDSRGALERHLEVPGMDEFAVREFVR